MIPNLQSQNLDIFVSLLTAKGVPVEDQKKILSDLDEAVVLNLIGRLDDRLSPDQKNELILKKPKKIEDLLNFFSEKIPANEVGECLKNSTEEVVEKFLEKI